MSDTRYLDWPFFEPRHRELAAALDEWSAAHLGHVPHADIDASCRALVTMLGEAGWLAHAVAGIAQGGASAQIDTRAICLIRETLARYDGLADFVFAMQGLGSGAISLHGTDAQKSEWLPKVVTGKATAAFALSEPNAGSDVAAMTCAARIDGDAVVIDGEKTWISNGGIADLRRVRTHRRSAWLARNLCVHRAGRHSGARHRGAHRRQRAASAGADHIHRVPHSDQRETWRAR